MMTEIETIFKGVQDIYSKTMAIPNNDDVQQRAFLEQLAQGMNQKIESFYNKCSTNNPNSRKWGQQIAEYKNLSNYFRQPLEGRVYSNIKKYSQWVIEALNAIYDEFENELANLTAQNQGAGI